MLCAKETKKKQFPSQIERTLASARIFLSDTNLPIEKTQLWRRGRPNILCFCAVIVPHELGKTGP